MEDFIPPPEDFFPPQMIFFPQGHAEHIRKQPAFLSSFLLYFIHPKLRSRRSRGGRSCYYPHVPLSPKDMERQMTGNGDSKIDPFNVKPIGDYWEQGKRHGAGLPLVTVCSEHPSEGEFAVTSMKCFPMYSLSSWHKRIKTKKAPWMY